MEEKKRNKHQSTDYTIDIGRYFEKHKRRKFIDISDLIFLKIGISKKK